MKVFIVQKSVPELDDPYYSHLTNIGVFDTIELAQEYIVFLKERHEIINSIKTQLTGDFNRLSILRSDVYKKYPKKDKPVYGDPSYWDPMKSKKENDRKHMQLIDAWKKENSIISDQITIEHRKLNEEEELIINNLLESIESTKKYSITKKDVSNNLGYHFEENDDDFKIEEVEVNSSFDDFVKMFRTAIRTRDEL